MRSVSIILMILKEKKSSGTPPPTFSRRRFYAFGRTRSPLLALLLKMVSTTTLAILTLSDQDFEKIEKEVEAVLSRKLQNEKTRIRQIKKKRSRAFSNNPFKCELIESFAEEPISAYDKGNSLIFVEVPTWPL